MTDQTVSSDDTVTDESVEVVEQEAQGSAVAVDEAEATPDADVLDDDNDQDDDNDDRDDSDEDDDEEDKLVEEGEVAADYLEQLLDILDFDGDIDLDVDGDRAIVSIDGGKDLNKLVGRNGEILDALQELTRLAVQQSTGDRSRLMLDVARWRDGRRQRLAQLGTEVSERVRDSGEREVLDPMTPFERKIVHDAVAAVAGVYSESEGVEPKRRVVVIKE
ncbi:protein jag [Gordonia sp. (in: high G+C Gram-positive bacteria)]|uniref:Jag family protein n=1 Tax=Gordonia sp. (in: high G+C Gram-positive bacteria) TaxID=84139 RepID=UPI003C790003